MPSYTAVTSVTVVDTVLVNSAHAAVKWKAGQKPGARARNVGETLREYAVNRR